jgi:hypothetical protein
MREAVAHARVELVLRQRIEQRGVVVDQKHEFHGTFPRCALAGIAASLPLAKKLSQQPGFSCAAGPNYYSDNG